jgi:hypothetical protein
MPSYKFKVGDMVAINPAVGFRRVVFLKWSNSFRVVASLNITSRALTNRINASCAKAS